ncbi:MAG: hypothetical protein AB7P21_29980 [Lautropia sp.]
MSNPAHSQLELELGRSDVKTYVWELGATQILIEVMPSGEVRVNGERVEPAAGGRGPGTPDATALPA